MKISIIIPAYNEQDFIVRTLQSLVEQTVKPYQILVVDDNSTDDTGRLVKEYQKEHPSILYHHNASSAQHLPGSKVIHAFHAGLRVLQEDYEVICKFDADLIFPTNYIERLSTIFNSQPEVGMAGGFCYIKKNGDWKLENLTNKDHIRGALKAYRKACFKDINGLKPAMGWDTLDELLAQYHGWGVKTDPDLRVKHLKPTGHTYTSKAKWKQGEAFYGMRYGFWLTCIASAKLALRKKSASSFFNYLQGYFKAYKSKKPFLVSYKEGLFIRKLRWRNIKKKLR